VKTEAAMSQMFANDRHAEIGSIPPAVLFRKWIAIMSGRVGASTSFGEERFPCLVGQTATLPIGSRIFSPMVEEANVVVLLLEGKDVTLDEGVEFVEIGGEVFGDVEIQWVSFAFAVLI
jgi:hypothetical protein